MADPVGPYGQERGRAGLDLDALVNKAEGRFRFVTLIQRRMRDLQRGAPPLVERSSGHLIDTAIEEYQQDKIWLVVGDEAKELRKERAARGAARLPPGKAGGTKPAGTGS